jgi:general transcription factor 3C polypeptide 5 (transcription factor C subunit 1)
MSSESDHASTEAPELPLSSTTFYSVEYPGYVQPASVPIAVRNLGGQECLDTVFKRNTTKPETLVELRLRPHDPFAHPIPGDVVATNNILLKVVKRKRRIQNEGSSSVSGYIGEYTTEAVGVIPKTIRFRSEHIFRHRYQILLTFDAAMADYQYQPDSNDPVVKLRRAMDDMDGRAPIMIFSTGYSHRNSRRH